MTAKRDFVSIEDFSNEEIEVLFVIADKMQVLLRQSHGLLAGHVMGSLFLEPSTRTRLSFEAAMNRLGGRVITLTDAGASSFSKGESLADSVRIISSYTDVIVLRHPQAGAARIAAQYAPVPVINAGDGGHEHPTQTLCDLYALRHTKGQLAGLKVILYGDLKYGRTTHSLALALTRFGTDVLCVPETNLELPSYVRERCLANPDVAEQEVVINDPDQVFGATERRGLLFSTNGAGWGINDQVLDLSAVTCDALYVTRLQKERFQGAQKGHGRGLAPVDMRFLGHRAFSQAVVLHPLPRVDEIDYAVDEDPRGFYFQQAALGVPVRMALVSFLLGREIMRVPQAPPRETTSVGDRHCQNMACVMASEGDYLGQQIWAGRYGPARCAFCDELLG